MIIDSFSNTAIKLTRSNNNKNSPALLQGCHKQSFAYELKYLLEFVSYTYRY